MNQDEVLRVRIMRMVMEWHEWRGHARDFQHCDDQLCRDALIIIEPVIRKLNAEKSVKHLMNDAER